MKFCRIATVIIIIAALLIPAVTARERGDHRYIVTPAEEMTIEDSPSFTPMTDGSIRQGETDWFATYIPAGKTELIIDLDWGDTSNSLRLRIYAPDAVLGPYYDAYDGVDGRIYLRIKSSVGLHPGTWQFEVYGHQVTDTQDYTIAWR
ncbi:MAG: pre-peptidase C-terminal domain-containing protein [Methanoculleus sp.]